MIELVNPASTLPDDLWEVNTVLHEPMDPMWPHVAIYLVQLIALLLPPFPARRTLLLAILAALAIQAQLAPHFSNDPGTVQPFTVSWSYYLATIEKFLFSEDGTPEKSFWSLNQTPKEAESMTAFGLSKLRWALMLVINQRGIRWNFQVKNVPPMEFSTKDNSMTGRLRFCASRLLDGIWFILCADLTFQLSRRILFTPAEGLQPGQLNSKYLTMRHPNPLWQLAKGLVFGSTPYFMVGAQYAIFSIVGVLTGLSQPADWPPLMGRLRDVTTVRDFWGKFWHQQLRRMLSTYAQRFVDAMGISRRTNVSSYSQLWLAFMISGAFHALSQRNLPRPVNITSAEVCFGFFYFFIWQAAAITVEDFFIWSWLRLTGDVGKQNSARKSAMYSMIGYIWVTLVLWHSIPYAGDTFLKMRVGTDSMLPFTLFGPYVEEHVPVPPLALNV